MMALANHPGETKYSRLEFLPRTLGESLLQFQREGIQYALQRNGRCLFGDEMGLGKTIQAISVAYFYKSEWPLLIVVPSSMRYPWIEELERWLPDLQPSDMNLITSGTDIRSIPRCKISLVGYGLLRNDSKTLMQVLTDQAFQVVIVDESHYMKNRKAARTKLLVPLLHKAKRAILLTGTPALGRPEELFTQIDSVRKGLMGSWSEFTKHYCNARWKHFGRRRMWDTSGASHLDELHKQLVQTVMIRREKNQVLTQLPPKRRQKVPFELADSEEKKELEKCWVQLDKVMSPLSNPVEELHNTGFEVKRLATQMYNLTGKAKIGAVCEYIKMLLENQGLKFLVFAHHKEVLTALAQTVAAHTKEHKTQLKYIRIDGDVPSLERMHLVKQFQTDSNTKVALLSILAAGTGLTLTAASHVVFAELHWTPGILEQCEDRAHRIGQLNAIHVHYLVARGTIDEWLWSTLSRKVNVLSSTLNGRVQHLRMEEKAGDEVEFLKHAAAWLPSNRDLEDDDSFYFASKKTSQDIRSFFTPIHSEVTKTRKRKHPSLSKPAETPPNPHTASNTEVHSPRTICNDDDDDDFQAVKKQRPCNDLSRKELFSMDKQSDSMIGCAPPGCETPGQSATATALGEVTPCTPSCEDAGIVAECDFTENLPDMTSNKKRRRDRGQMCTSVESPQPRMISEHDSEADDQDTSRSDAAHGMSRNQAHRTPHQRSIQSQIDGPRTLESSRYRQEQGTMRKKDKAVPHGPSSAEVDPVDRWSCCACTFENHADLPFCEICSTPRKITRSRVSKPDRIETLIRPLYEAHTQQNTGHFSNDEKESKSQSTKSSLSASPRNNALAPVDHAGGSSVKATKTKTRGNRSNTQEHPDITEKSAQTTNENIEEDDATSSGSEATVSYDLPTDQSYTDVVSSYSPPSTGTCSECPLEHEIHVCTKLALNDTEKTESAIVQTSVPDPKLAKEIEEATACYLDLMPTSKTVVEQWSCDDSHCGYVNTTDDSECEACWSPRPKQRLDPVASEKTKPSGFIKASQVHQSDKNRDNELEPEQKLSKDIPRAEETASCSSRTETEDEPELYESFLYCPSKHTDRIYLYDQDGRALNCSFLAIDLQHCDLDALPQVLRNQHNMRIALRFLREWNSLNEVKRKQLRKMGEMFDSPLAALDAVKQGQHYQLCTKRFITKVDLAEAARQKAESLGGSVRVISKARPTTTSTTRRSHHRPAHHEDMSVSTSGSEEQVSHAPRTKPQARTSPARQSRGKPKTTAKPKMMNMKHTSHLVHARNTNTAESQQGSNSLINQLKPTQCPDGNSPKLKRGTYVQAVDGEGRPLCVFCGKVASSTAVETHQSAAWDMRYCSETCKDEHSLRWKNTKCVRQQLLEAEHGVCQLCGLEAQQLCNNIKDAAKAERKELLEHSVFSKMSTHRLNEIVRNPSSGQNVTIGRDEKELYKVNGSDHAPTLRDKLCRFWHADHVVAVMEGGGLCSLDNYRTLCVLCHDKVTAQQNIRRRNQNRAAGIPDIRSFFNP